MKNKKSLIGILSVLLIAVIGLTFAYFQTTATFTNLFNTGTYHVVTTEVFESPDNWAPGQEIPKTITSKNEGTIPAAVRVSYTEQWIKEIDGVETDITSQVASDTVIVNLDNTEDWIHDGNYYYYKYILNPNDTTSSFIKSVTLNSNINGATCIASQDGLTQTCESSNPALGATYKLTITKETVQANKYQEVWNSSVRLKEKTSYVNTSHEVYYNPVDDSTCNSSTHDETNAKNGTSNCYKWNVVSQEGNKTTLMLSYNLADSAWGSSDVTSTGPTTALTTLKNTTSNWNKVDLLNYEYDSTYNELGSYGVLSCTDGECKINNNQPFVTGLRARLITAEEIVNVVCETGDFNFETNRACTTFNIRWGVNNPQETDIYRALEFYDSYTYYSGFYDSVKWIINEADNFKGYHTISPMRTDYAWQIYSGYLMAITPNDTSGIRPVITIPTSSITIN